MIYFLQKVLVLCKHPHALVMTARWWGSVWFKSSLIMTHHDLVVLATLPSFYASIFLDSLLVVLSSCTADRHLMLRD